MSIRRKIRLPFSLRVFVLALLALSMVLQPVVASMGEIHEFAHDPAEHSAQAGHPDLFADDSAKQLSEGETPGTLHLLLHLAHCCGQSPAIAAPALLMPPPMSVAGSAATCEPQAPPDIRALAPFRPPTTV